MWKSSFRNLDWDISDKFMTYPTLPNAESASSVFRVRARLYINCFRNLGIMYQPFGIHWTHMRRMTDNPLSFQIEVDITRFDMGTPSHK